MKPLYKTTVIIWSEVNPDEWELVVPTTTVVVPGSKDLQDSLDG